MPLIRQTFRRAGRARGFTLMELITVITVIAVLASVLVPMMGKTITAAKKRKSTLLFINLANAFEAYRAEYGRYPVFPELSASTTTSSATQEKDYSFNLNASNNLMRRVLMADPSYMSQASSSGATNYNGRQRQFLLLDEAYLSTNPPGTSENPSIVDGFGNNEIGVVIHAGPTREIDRSAFTVPVYDPEGDNSLAPSVVRNLPQPIAIYSLIRSYNNDPVSSSWNANWSYDDYSQ